MKPLNQQAKYEKKCLYCIIYLINMGNQEHHHSSYQNYQEYAIQSEKEYCVTPKSKTEYVILSRLNEWMAFDVIPQDRKTHLWGRHNEKNQRYYINEVGQNHHEIWSLMGEWIGAEGNSDKSGARIVSHKGVKSLWEMIPVDGVENCFYLKTRGNLALDASGGEANVATHTIQWQFHGRMNQQWYIMEADKYFQTEFELDPLREYAILSKMNTEMAVDISRAAKDKKRALLWGRHNQSHQRFKIKQRNNNKYEFTSALNQPLGPEHQRKDYAKVFGREGVCNVWKLLPIREDENCFYLVNDQNMALDAEEGKSFPGTKLCAYFFHGGKNQQWYIIPSDKKQQKKVKFDPVKEYVILSRVNRNMALDVNQHPNQKNKMIVWNKHKGPNQKYIIREAYGKFLIYSVAEGSLKVPNATKEDTQIIIGESENSKEELWQIIPAEEKNVFYLKSFCDKALDLAMSKAEPGNVVVQYWFHGGNNQKWYIEPA